MEVEHREDDLVEQWSQSLKKYQMTRADMNLLVMDYLEKEGCKEAAEKFRVEAGVSPTIDLATLDKRIQIRNFILKGEIENAIVLINELHPELLDNDNALYFLLQQQQLIELIRSNKVEEALEFAKSHVAERAEDREEFVLTELEKTLALLVFDEPASSPFGDLLSQGHKQKVASEVNAKILEQENQESVPQIAKLLKLLIWSQKHLDAQKVKYVKMTEFAKGELKPS